nr:MAG TPA: hypothetical protein [Caudoviricetes sp.]
METARPPSIFIGGYISWNGRTVGLFFAPQIVTIFRG